MSEINKAIEAYLQHVKNVADLSPWRVWTDEDGRVHAVREAEPHLDPISLKQGTEQ
jgi:hypothetical protein